MQPDAPTGHCCTLRLCLATLNVLTLKGTNAKQHGLQGLCRQTLILRQLYEAGAHIFALQETRQKKQTLTLDSDYVLITSSANSQGHFFGLMVGFDRRRPHGFIRDESGQDKSVMFHPSHFTIIHTSPRQLIVKVHSPALKCLVMAGHAPHTGATSEEADAWWKNFSSHVPAALAHWHRFGLVDANCRLGHFPSECVGSWQAEKDTHATLSFSMIFSDMRMLGSLLRSRKANPVNQELGDTRMANGFVGTMLDYPNSYFAVRVTCKAYVSNMVDASIAKEDHRAAFVELESCYEIFTQPLRKHSTTLFDEAALLENIKNHPAHLLHHLQTVSPLAWDVDVHTHVEHLSQELTGALQTVYTSPTKKPRKTTMSSTTWDLVQRKRGARNALAALNQQQAWGLLRVCLVAWKDAPLHIDYLRDFDTVLTHLDVLIAKELDQFRTLGRLTSAAMRADGVTFFTELAQEAADF